MNRWIIAGGAEIRDYDWIRSHLQTEDFLVCCDSGLRHCPGLGREPDLIVGDFDSHENPGLPTETIVLPREKDDTDTAFAVKEGLRRGVEEFLLIGAAGGRLDHTLGNISLLLHLDSLGKTAFLLDDESEIRIVSRGGAAVNDSWSYFSLLNVDGSPRGISIEAAKYPLQNAEIPCDYAYAVSNEPLPGQTARISLREGRLLLVKVR